jgi:hypothetical protein
MSILRIGGSARFLLVELVKTGGHVWSYLIRHVTSGIWHITSLLRPPVEGGVVSGAARRAVVEI